MSVIALLPMRTLVKTLTLSSCVGANLSGSVKEIVLTTLGNVQSLLGMNVLHLDLFDCREWQKGGVIECRGRDQYRDREILVCVCLAALSHVIVF